MHWSSVFISAELLKSSIASLQQPLTAEKNQLQTPFDDVFDNKVEWALDHFHIPGVGIAVVRDNEVFTKVSYDITKYHRPAASVQFGANGSKAMVYRTLRPPNQ